MADGGRIAGQDDDIAVSLLDLPVDALDDRSLNIRTVLRREMIKCLAASLEHVEFVCGQRDE